MKRIMLVLISVIMLFTACVNIQKESPESSSETTIPTQIDPAEEFDGILFGMTTEEVVEILDRQPDYIDTFLSSIMYYYYGENFFNISSANMVYEFEDNKLISISIVYIYSNESEKQQMPIDYLTIKEELLARYPEGNLYSYGERDFDIDTYNRHIYLSYMGHSINVTIENTENIETNDNTVK